MQKSESGTINYEKMFGPLYFPSFVSAEETTTYTEWQKERGESLEGEGERERGREGERERGREGERERGREGERERESCPRERCDKVINETLQKLKKRKVFFAHHISRWLVLSNDKKVYFLFEGEIIEESRMASNGPLLQTFVIFQRIIGQLWL